MSYKKKIRHRLSTEKTARLQTVTKFNRSSPNSISSKHSIYFKGKGSLDFYLVTFQRKLKILHNHFPRSCRYRGLGLACMWICVRTGPCLHIARQIRLARVQITVSSHSAEVHRTVKCDVNAVKY